ncbi:MULTISPECIES: hypothetical protein [Burkholderia]|uniref:hypothetical protein n=1 Tax=Burkholderia TaxID=32008 RepID=UPI0011777EA4|nr:MULTISPECIES: hypothetical protein [Burkholderia]MBN3839906.1 hypothetical protein [Burkholderia sp. Ac-20349]
MRTVLVPVRLFSLAATSYAGDFRPRAGATPDLAHPKRFQSNGLSFQRRITADDPLDGTDGRGVSIKTDKSAFEGLNPEVVVQMLRSIFARACNERG